ncbi:hypothetical protein GJAV_G00020450 [Gymnothorax javanicus]|nr:hypothetical protein GJAV_G00020450 [Gymnothorax javanicus]
MPKMKHVDQDYLINERQLFSKPRILSHVLCSSASQTTKPLAQGWAILVLQGQVHFSRSRLVTQNVSWRSPDPPQAPSGSRDSHQAALWNHLLAQQGTTSDL